MLEGSVWTGDDVGSGPVWTGDDTISGPVWTGDNTSPDPVWTGDGDDTSPVNLNTFSAATKRVLLSILIFVVIMTVVIVPIILIVNHQNSGIAESTSTASADDDTVDLSNYYNKTEVDSLIPKGVLAEGSFNYVTNNSSTFNIAQGSFFAASPNIGWTSSDVILAGKHFGNPIYWSQAPECTQLIYKFTFTSPILDDAGQETSEYKVMLTRRDIVHSHHNTIYDLAVYEKTPEYFQIRVEVEVDTANYHIESHGFDFVVF